MIYLELGVPKKETHSVSQYGRTGLIASITSPCCEGGGLPVARQAREPYRVNLVLGPVPSAWMAKHDNLEVR